MIPDFKTFLNESIWSDMQERGTGDLERKEDEFDFIGGFKLYERLRKMYKYTNVTGHIIAYYNNTGLITVPLFVDEGMNIFNIDYFVNSGKLSIYARWYDDARKIFMKLSKKYHIYHPNISIYHIEPFDGDVTNTFFIEVVDFILSCVEPPYKKLIERKDPVSESIWSDMQDRGTGDIVKIEDDVDRIYDIKKLYEYIQKRYDPEKRSSSLTPGELTLSIGVDYFSEYGAKDLRVKLYWWKNEKVLNISCTKPVLEELSKKYDIADGGRQLKQRGDDLKNSTIIGVIDTILEVIPKHKSMEAFIK